MANTIVRWNPIRELAAMQSAMDRLFEENWRGFGENFGQNALSLDVDENDNAYTVTTELPGVTSENINIRVHDGVLTIDAEIPERTVEHNGEGSRALMRERRYGRFTRSIRLPQPVNTNDVQAEFENGVLTLTLPKSEEAQPKQIPVRMRGNGSNN